MANKTQEAGISRGMTRRNFLGIQALPSEKDLLVCIFQRGAADGLNSVVPYGDTDYAIQRGTLAIPPPFQVNGAIDLDGFFGFHPALAPLKPMYDMGDLALVHATGFPHGSRSHFDAQGLAERGVIDKAESKEGWLGRHLALSSGTPGTAFRSVSISGNVPVALQGVDQALAISNISEFGFDQEIIDSGYTEILGKLFRSPLPFSSPGLAALSAIDELNAANLASITPDNGAVYPSGALGGKLAQVAQLVKSTLPVEVVCLDSDGWDHHENLPVYLNQSLDELAKGLAAFYTDMGERMQSITVLVYTEFGRRVAKNASNGVDHGTGALAYLMGGGVKGGQVYGAWPGLANENLERNEDLSITTDMREVLSEMLNSRLGGTDTGKVFPGFSSSTPLNLFTAR